jgi:hypothetical protein
MVMGPVSAEDETRILEFLRVPTLREAQSTLAVSAYRTLLEVSSLDVILSDSNAATEAFLDLFAFCDDCLRRQLAIDTRMTPFDELARAAIASVLRAMRCLPMLV